MMKCSLPQAAPHHAELNAGRAAVLSSNVWPRPRPIFKLMLSPKLLILPELLLHEPYPHHIPTLTPPTLSTTPNSNYSTTSTV